jgi:serine/threonine protein kinase
MTNPSPVEAIFFAALDQPAGPPREAYLSEACRGDDDLRRRVERLLDAHPQAGGFLEKPAAEGTGAYVSAEAAAGVAGDFIGPYKLLQKLGEGGMGAVWMAEQEQPVRRRVALKVIKAGMDSAQVVARFEAERQALALMDHPNIAKVLDAGTTEAGRPYFVMELVKGIPITRFCDQEHLTPNERLALFVPVCQAVQHAHQKGIIHRDLKPSNVLIALYDGRPVPKVIDFGVAKATGTKLTERTLFTEVGNIVGTLEYMAPEQAELNNLDIDTRADVYALGVLLYELLTGSPPFTRKQLRSAAFTEMLRMIREVEPPKPSTRLSGSDELPSIAANRKLEPAKLARLVRGDLDWIVMKALEKDRARRYETANGLALDVQRYLADEPVLAGPPGAGYRVRKFARKHRRAVATAMAFAALLLLGAAVSAWQAVRARQAEAAALVARDSEAAAAAEARAVLKFFQDKVLAAARPEGQEDGLGREATIRAAVDAAERWIGSAFADRPTVEAAIRNTLGKTYDYLGEPALAIRQLERARALRRDALGPDHPDTLTSMHDLASAYLSAGRLPDAAALHEETLKLRRLRLGADHPDTLTSMTHLARTYRAMDRLNDAIKLYEDTLKLRRATLGYDHRDTLDTMDGLALAYVEAGGWQEGLPLHEETLRRRRTKFGPDHPDTLNSMNNLAMAYSAAGREADAMTLNEATLKLTQAKLGPDHPDTLTVMHNLALSYASLGRTDDALALSQEALKRHAGKLGPDHPDALYDRLGLAWMYQNAGRLADARALLEENVTFARAKLSPDHQFTLSTTSHLARCCHQQGEYARAEVLFREVINRGKAALGEGNPEVAAALSGLGQTYVRQQKFAEAEPLFRESVAIYKKIDADDWHYFSVQRTLGGGLVGLKRYAEAEPLLLAGYDGLKQRLTKVPAPYRATLLSEAAEWLVQLYEATGRPDEAAKWRKELEAVKAQDKK